jgi:hypothetical protein
MYENTEPWDKNIPVDLIPSITHLRKSFDDAHWGCGWTTKAFCYSLLHNEAVDDPAREFINYLMHIKARVGPAATQRFHDLVKASTPSSIFKAFYDLYLDGVGVQALVIFKELVEIGRANEARLSVPHLEWAEAQTKHLIRSQTHNIRIWVQNVCDKQVHDPSEDDEELIYWRKWQAPMLVVMTPSRYKPYDAATVWERNAPETSARWLKSFAEAYVLHLEMKVRRAAGDAALELAKQPKPIHASAADDNTQREGLPPPKSPRTKPTNSRVEVRKLDTQAKYKSWQTAYRKLRKRRPDESDVWYSLQIATMAIGKGSSTETIRKHMKRRDTWASGQQHT